MWLSRRQNAGQNRDTGIANRSFENVSQFKHLGTAVTSQTLIQGEIRNKLNYGNTCYQNLLSFRLLSKNVTIKIYLAIILPVDFFWM
jgi:hypothetical protein